MGEKFTVPEKFRHTYPSKGWTERSAPFSIEYLCRLLGLESLEHVEMLDVGCGTKFTQYFINHDQPIGRYVGVDVYAEMIEALRENVDDPRFEYHHVDLKNARYNPDGRPLTEDTELPIGAGREFDLITLFSVFTHLDPHDYRAMLKVLRRHVKPDGRLFFSLFIDEKTEGGHGFIDKIAAVEGDSVVGQTDGYRDYDPADVLAYPLYSKEYAYELIEGTGWEVVRLDPPNQYIQHHFTCRPI